MNFLKELKNSQYLKEFDDNTELPEKQIKNLQSLIRKGIENSDRWSNALEVVHKAYEVSGIERPTPDMKASWKQYEILIAYSVEQLAKHYGVNGNWRMTSESFKEKSKFLIEYSSKNINKTDTVSAYSVNDIIRYFESPSYNINAKYSKNSVLLEFWEHNIIKSNNKIKITEIKQ